MSELLPCPFCGADMMHVHFVTVKFMKPTTKGIVCNRCGAIMSADMNTLDNPSEIALQDYIIEKWNTRTQTERVAGNMGRYDPYTDTFVKERGGEK